MTVLAHFTRALAVRVGRPRPIYAHVGVTHRCNMRCRMCVVWRSADRDTELTVAQIETLAGHLHEAGVRTIALGGGEPFIREDLPDIVRRFHERGMIVRLLTNGLRISDDRLQSVIHAGLAHVSISLDTLDPDKEKDIYNGEDVWEEIVDTMRRFRAALTKPSALPVMNVCVSRMNLEELPALVTFAQELGFLCSFVPIALSHSEKESDGFAAVAPDLAIQAADHDAITTTYNELIRMKQAGAPIANSTRFLWDSLTYLTSGRTPWTCDAGALYLSVSPEGEIAMCHRFPAIAHFDTPNLGRLLQSADTRARMKQQRDPCPGCMRPCWAEVTHALHHWPTSWEALRMARRPRTTDHRSRTTD